MTRLSVVICALGRPGADAAVASVLASAEAGGIDVQALLVWQSQDDPPPLPPGGEVVRAFPAGNSYARNVGIAASVASVIAFVDDDERAEPGWATAVLAAFAEGADVAVGPIEPSDDEGLPHCHFTGEDLRWYSDPSTPAWTVGSGGNMAVRRDLLCELGGFDLRLGAGSFGRSAGDTDLLQRLLARRARIRWRPDMVVKHPTKTAAERLASRRPYGFGAGRMARQMRSPATAGRYGAGVLWGLREAARERSGRSARELAASASGFAAGALCRYAWTSPDRLLGRVPAAISEAIGDRPLHAWRVPHRTPPHFLWAAGSDLVLHAYAGATTGETGEARRTARAAGVGGIPALRAAALDDDVRWVLEERLPGRPPRTRNGEWWSTAADWAEGLAATAGPPLRTTAWWDAALRGIGASPAFASAAEQIGDLPAVVVHGDLQPKNLLVGSEGTLGVLDWEGAIAEGPPGLDLLYLAVGALPLEARPAAVHALARGSDPSGAPVLARLRRAGLEPAAAVAALTVAVHVWAAEERARRSRLGVPPQSAHYEPLIACLPQRAASFPA